MTEKPGEPGGQGPSTAGAVAKFALAGLAAVALVGVAAFFLMRHIGTTEAIDNAKKVTRVVGRGVVEPQLTNGVLAGDPASMKRLDRVVHRRVLGDSIVRVKIWDPSGRIVYSDQPQLIGQRYSLGADELASIRGSGEVDAGVSDLSAPENRFERSYGKLLEVYLPIHAPNGEPLLFEVYQRFSSIASSGSSIWLAFAPALIGALILLELVHVPLASSMARRLRRGHREREALLQRAIDASELERRRIASDLHDGVVQRLAGASFSLSAAADRAVSESGSADALRAGAEQTRQSVRELRSLLVEIYPASLREAGLEAALSDLLAPLAGKGVETSLDVDSELELSQEREALFFRVAQEALRNAGRYAEAGRVEVRLAASNGDAVLTVADDGKGFDVAAAPAGNGSGHMGLRLLAELARDAGAELDVDSAPGRGTTVRVEGPPR